VTDERTSFHLHLASRWDAVELMEALLPYRPFLVQRGPSAWEVRAEADCEWPALVDDLYRRAVSFLRERSLESLEIRMRDGTTLVVWPSEPRRQAQARRPRLAVHRPAPAVEAGGRWHAA
jgi:hypothetical protein